MKRLEGEGLEKLDQACLDREELRRSLEDVVRLNRWFGGTRSVLRAIDQLVAEKGLRGRISILDAGCGSGDLLRALSQWGERRGFPVDAVGCDRHAQVLEAAAGSFPQPQSPRLVRSDVLLLPFPDGSFDVAVCSLLFHHLKEAEVVRLLDAMRRLVRHGVIVSDLERSRRAWAGVWLATRSVCRSPYTRHDGPLSVRRAYTLDELRALGRRAGCERMQWRRGPLFRVTGVLTL